MNKKYTVSIDGRSAIIDASIQDIVSWMRNNGVSGKITPARPTPTSVEVGVVCGKCSHWTTQDNKRVRVQVKHADVADVKACYKG